MRARRGNRRKTRVERVPARGPGPEPRIPMGWPAAGLVLGLTFLAYVSTLRFGFLYDDGEQIVHNPNIQSWSYLPKYFSESLWSHGGWFKVRFYRPMFLVWLRLNDAVFGLTPACWHLTTVAAHLLATLMVYLLVRRLLGRWQPSMWAALFFGLHPVHVQVVAWISSVSESLLAAALVGSLVCYAAGRKSSWRVAGSLALYAVSLGLKETAMVFPAMIFVYAWLWPETGRRTRPALLQTLPYAGLTAIYLAVRWSVLEGVVKPETSLGVKTIVLTLPSLLLFYGKLLVWPVGLSAFYNTPLVQQASGMNFVFPLAVLLAAACGMAALGCRAWKSKGLAERRVAVLGCVWMGVFLAPAMYLPALQDGAYVQDRYLYLPSIGLAMLLGVGLDRVGRGSRRFLGMPWIQAATAVVVAGAMAVGVWKEKRIWASNLALFTRAAERDPEATAVQHNLAAALLDAGRHDDAIVRLRELLRHDPDNPEDNNNLGQALLNEGDQAGAEEYLAKSCALHPTPWQLYQLGSVRYNLGHADGAEQALRQAIALNPGGAGYHYVLGLALARQNKLDAAKEAFEEELAAHPGDQKTTNELSRLEAFQAAHPQRAQR